MTKEELLKKARDDYPEGTVHTGYMGKSEYIVKGELYFLDDSIYSRDENGCIYYGYKKSWAKIISKPKQKDVFKTFI